MRDPNVPESVEGWWILHRMFAFDRRAWDGITEKRRIRFASHAKDLFEHLKSGGDRDAALTQLVGHKGDLMVTHYAKTYEDLAYVQTLVDKLEVREFLKPLGSYVSVLEIGMYDATAKIHAEMATRDLTPNSVQWNDAFDELVRKQAESPYVAPRLFAKIPDRRYVCFYPMNKKREGADNWFMLPFADRARLMTEHGKIGRKYHGQVTQVISGSIGFDDYEWGVDLYADDPMVFKKLVYEMRFDEASARYGEFGAFWSGVQFAPAELRVFLDGDAVAQLHPG
ncbi:MAG TPA: hydrogen peroxide-dependent heme synthase [Candidatus Baltobacteraceae bacterium]|jgi:chlorite dismutase|nr:hydrogen peroxide-dependent heme synthase [Candidatus Baltobacteraceae bacterium]